MSQIAGEDVSAPLIDAGVKLFYFQPAMLYTKLLIVDGVVACIGSANFNHFGGIQRMNWRLGSRHVDSSNNGGIGLHG